MDRGYSPQGPKESYRPEVTEHTHSLKGGQARKQVFRRGQKIRNHLEIGQS